MDIKFECLKCKQSIVVDEASAGIFVNCPTCKFSQLVPGIRKSSSQSDDASKIHESQMRLKQFLHKTDSQIEHETSPVPECNIADVLKFIAVLDFIGAAIGGLIVGQDSVSSGFLVFFSCVLGGIFVLGFSYALKYLHAIAYRLEKIESTQKTAK